MLRTSSHASSGVWQQELQLTAAHIIRIYCAAVTESLLAVPFRLLRHIHPLIVLEKDPSGRLAGSFVWQQPLPNREVVPRHCVDHRVALNQHVCHSAVDMPLPVVDVVASVDESRRHRAAEHSGRVEESCVRPKHDAKSQAIRDVLQHEVRD